MRYLHSPLAPPVIHLWIGGMYRLASWMTRCCRRRFMFSPSPFPFYPPSLLHVEPSRRAESSSHASTHLLTTKDWVPAR
ncbi:hypothetical protein BDQ12DRAFT_685632 [Crucibulum laeve]|uniref:Uncharacterized protein n=1 Tax=Crucibulum laeve TaxID=68775 RepID=A0A5C3LVX9_9AGAR|nr:hypothetical protein BDQ12DRAFT_685632 [Crucibulum laeve]